MSSKKLDFRNTEVAYADKSDADLRMAELLFRTIANPAVVKLGKVGANVAGALHMPLGWALRPTIYKHFVGGESLEQSKKTLERLNQRGVQAVMDYSAEGGDDKETIEKTFQANMKAVRFAHNNPAVSHAVFKVSGICKVAVMEKANDPDAALMSHEREQVEKLRERFMALCEAAHEQGTKILVDAEHYAYQGLIDRLTEEAMLKYNKERAIVFATLQMYRHDRMDYLRGLDEFCQEHALKCGIKFVRGAYMEEERARAARMGYRDPICANKAETDTNFNAGVKYVVDRINRFELFCGTHNERSCVLLTEQMAKQGLANNDPRIYISQLYGMGDFISYNLSNAGYNVTKYLPYAPVDRVLPYLIRRAEENTSVAGQTGRELELIRRERERRKGK